jgi:Mg2+-importing ATPase
VTNPTTGLMAWEVAKAPKNTPPHHFTSMELALHVAKNQVLSFFFILLLISGALSVLLHEHVDATIFFTIASINAVLGFAQEFRANRSAQLLEKMVAHYVTVRRNGQLKKIPNIELVLGDILLLNPGDIIAVDCQVITSTDAFLDESVITGESLPRLIKSAEQISAGATVVSGSLVAEVTAVGQDNSLSKYAEKVVKLEKNSNFEKFIHTISKTILIVTAVCLLLVLVVNVLTTHGMSIPEYILFSISMLIGVVPESLPLIVTLIFTSEAISLSKQQVLIKKLSALQNLGSMNYLFTDKTGTITENVLRVKEIVALEESINKNLITISGGNYERMPMDEVFDNALAQYFTENGQMTKQEGNRTELGFEAYQASRGYAIHLLPSGDAVFRGQYDEIIKVCRNVPDDFRKKCQDYETHGLRVIAIAYRSRTAGTSLQGLVVFEDPLKPDAVSIYKTISGLGISMKIITGDTVEVAEYIGNILEPEKDKNYAIGMNDLKNIPESKLDEYFIYARCKPEQKSLVIDSHEHHGVVGFLGEGVNDAMALKRADIGFVVNNASDIARQAGDVILLEKSLHPIVNAVMLSRRAFNKVRTYLLCTLTGNIGTLISLTTIVVLSQQIPLLPIQILLNNLLTDLPLLFLLSDRISEDSLKRPLKDEARKFFKIIIIFAAISSVFDFIFFFMFRGFDITILRTGWFVFSVLAELTLVVSLRSELSIFKAPRISVSLTLALLACLGAAVALPFLPFRALFSFVPLNTPQLIMLAGLTAIYLATNEIIKHVFRKQLY